MFMVHNGELSELKFSDVRKNVCYFILSHLAPVVQTSTFFLS